MGQTKEGALKGFRNRNNIGVDEFQNNLSAGLKWCFGCKTWHEKNNFGSDRSRDDGLAASCKKYRRLIFSKTYSKKLFKTTTRGLRFVPVRDGDKKQARRRVNHLVEAGMLSNPNEIPCTDCGHLNTNDVRHEYDHYLGYKAEYQETVEAVCTQCHHKRERIRRLENVKK
jgi:hypothetical protein